MRTLFTCVLWASLSLAEQPQSASLSGRWTGVWVRQRDTLHVEFTFCASGDSVHGAFSSVGLRAAGIPLHAVTVRAKHVHFELRGDASTTIFDGAITGDTLRSNVRDGTAVSTLQLARTTETTVRLYDDQDARFTSGDVTLTGTLLMPRGATGAPAVVMLHGSGPEERTANRYLAEQLAAHGVAALIYDKRGTGASSGDWQKSTFADLASDAEAGVDWVRRRAGINSHLVGIYGHSQGAMIGPMIASRSHHVAFFIASAAAGLPLEQVERYSVENSFGISLMSPVEASEAARYVRALVHSAYTGLDRAVLDSLIRVDSAKPWFRPPPAPDNYYWTFARSIATHDVLRYWRDVDVPVLLIYGQSDERVPVEPSIAGIRGALGRAGIQSCRLRVFPDADHSMRMVSRPGEPFRWPQNADGYLDTIVDWILDESNRISSAAGTRRC